MKYKESIPLSVLFAVLGSITFAQPSKTKTEQEIKSMLCHKWHLTYVEAKGKKMPAPNDTNNDFVLFKPDGTLTEMEVGKERRPGKWTYNHSDMTLKIDDADGIDVNKIVKITSTDLVLQSKFDNVLTKWIMKWVD